MDIRGWLLFARDWFLFMVAGTALAAIAAFALSGFLPKTYEASTTLLVGQSLTAPNPDYSQLLASQFIAGTFAEVATSRPSLENVIAILGLDTTPEGLAQDVLARAPANSTLVVVTAQAGDPDTAAAISNAMATTLLDMVDATAGPGGVTAADLEQVNREIDAINVQINDLLALAQLTPAQQSTLNALRDQVATLREQRATLIQQLAGSSNRLTVVDPAFPPEQPIAPRVVLNAGIGAFLGLIITALAAYTFESALRPDAHAQRVATATGTVSRFGSGNP